MAEAQNDKQPEKTLRQRGVFSAVLQRWQPDGWRLAAACVALLVIVPLTVIFTSWTDYESDIWEHLSTNLLADLLVNTAWLVGGVASGTAILGVSLAWLTAVCEFPGRRFFSWALLLPLAMPTYVLAFVCLGLFDYAGPIQTLAREWFGSSDWLPDMQSTFGVVSVMTAALYPYVYLLARNAFITQGKRMLEAAESLGCGPWRAFFRVVLPMARPWIAGGVMLVLMEALADFGAVSIFNYNTFTTAIYKAWFGFFSLSTAAQLASCLVMLVFIIVVIEQKMRSRMRFSENRLSSQPERITLTGKRKWLVFTYAATILGFAFIFPTIQLLVWVLEIFGEEFGNRYLTYLWHSLLLGLLAAVIISVIATILSYAARRHPDVTTRFLVRISNLGYALPGTVLAVGIYIPLAAIDNFLIDTARSIFNIETGQLLQGTIIIMMLAYTIRFMAAGFKPIDGTMHRITPSIDEAARLHGYRGATILRKIHVPILRSGIFTAATLVFVDVMKEMPITLMTRPFGWDTLSVKIFELTSEGEWERAALPAIFLLISGLLPIILLMRQTEK